MDTSNESSARTDRAGALCTCCKRFFEGSGIPLCDCNVPRRYYRVQSVSMGGFYIEREAALGGVLSMVRRVEAGDGYTITAVMMTPAEYSRLPEFTGF
jgi:hypothetical protein